jgi:hypothetical protein
MEKIERLAQQIRKELVADMDKNTIRAFVERNYPELSPREKSELVKVLTATPIPDEGEEAV